MPKPDDLGLFVRTANRLITAVLTEIAVILLIDYTPGGHALFGTAPIGWDVWLGVLPFAIGMLVLEEIRKAFMRLPSMQSLPAIKSALASARFRRGNFRGN